MAIQWNCFSDNTFIQFAIFNILDFKVHFIQVHMVQEFVLYKLAENKVILPIYKVNDTSTH